MSWDNNNVAHTNLWGFERWKLKDKTVTFKEAGEQWAVSYLIGGAAGEGQAMRNDKATAHATALDEVFTDFYHAGYEAGVTQASAVAAMSAILSDSSKFMKDLGDPVSDAYKFQGEV